MTGSVPSESTFRRTLQRLDADAFDDLAGQWAARRTAPGPGGRRVIAVDGKTLRGSGHGEQNGRHLLAALDHVHGAVLGQVEVGVKINEIPLFSTLLDRIGISGAVVTADALHAQREHGPRIMASLRNLVITILRLAGAASIIAAMRYHARRPSRPFQTITKCQSDSARGTANWPGPNARRTPAGNRPRIVRRHPDLRLHATDRLSADNTA